MPKRKKGAKARSKKIGFFIYMYGSDPLDADDFPEVLGTLNAAIEEAKMELDDEGDVITIYELVPRARVEVPETPDVIVEQL